jgi:acetoacetate decarboxylase
MKINDVRRAAYAMPLTNPAFRGVPIGFSTASTRS